jgi:GT2 family glycosyltransferase
MSTTRLIALVVTFNRLDQLKTTVTQLLKANAAHLAGVLVVDNASTDGTADWLATQTDPRLHVLSLKTNSGGAGGFAAGMKEALHALSPDWLVLMDDDARPDDGTLLAFHARPRDTKDVWIAATYFPSGIICEMNRPWVNPFKTWRNFWAAARGGWAGYHISNEGYAASTPTNVDGASFVGYFVSAQAARLAGYPDPKLFIYGDDVLYSLKLNALGGTFAFDPKLTFEHDCTADMGVHPVTPLWKVYYLYRNQLFVYRKAAGPVLFWPIAMLKAIGWRRRARAYGDQCDVYKALWKRAIIDGLKGRRDASFDQVRDWSKTDPNA